MSKRTQSIRSLFAAGADEQSETKQPVQRVASGAVKSLKDTFSEVERDYEELKGQIASGAIPVELDPALVDPSPFADRFTDQDTSAIEALKASIREHGQEIPILVRVHPTQSGRYQISYGHRRVRAASELGVKVKAYVRELDDGRLAVAQGIENSAREDLTFIERVAFALKLEDSGFQRQVIQTALSVDRQEVYKLVTVGRAVPGWLLGAIGRAPKIGRPRWQELADALKLTDTEDRARKAIAGPEFGKRSSDDRFMVVLRALKKSGETATSSRKRSLPIAGASGASLGKLLVSDRELRVSVDDSRGVEFIKFIEAEMPGLAERFAREHTEDQP